jgi:antitoxin component YwqK of YwqJK toxin-antitoxin module
MVEKRDEAGRQVERYSVDKKTKLKEGLHEAFYVSGAKAEESHYKNGILTGEQIFYFENGQVQERRTFGGEGNFSGPYKSYHNNGRLKSEGQYANGAMSGKWKFFYLSGNIREILHYKNNTEDGPFIEYFDGGKISAEGTYRNELEEGLLKIYNKEGELTKQMQCENGACRTVWKSNLHRDEEKKL